MVPEYSFDPSAESSSRTTISSDDVSATATSTASTDGPLVSCVNCADTSNDVPASTVDGSVEDTSYFLTTTGSSAWTLPSAKTTAKYVPGVSDDVENVTRSFPVASASSTNSRSLLRSSTA